ncbi:hypothetical protein BVC80_8895g11 [Macleaya cordata]|uniref:Uncharacterized protein n=1 Tax=Macleaya cordata TaxID=56857 RepID=A0A200Q3W5_MACCD|nr:hypothetical protein BVC80_8895g11 [Macleaya cordata]
MAQHPCLNRMSPDHTKYASPVPVIGLYTAMATILLFLSMLNDTLVGFRRKKPWLPCRFFALNSFTLSLLSIATKLPVDLTTSMPSAQDQISKLSSTTLICICMGFFMPSLGIKQEAECFSNMAALTVLVLTVVVDVCLQMATGVIFVFKVEHVIVLVCMLVLLAVLWSSILDINRGKELIMDHNRHLFEKGLEGREGSDTMIQRLKWCYMYSFSSNPQFVLCQISHCATIGMLCTVCSVVLSEAVLRTKAHKELKFSISTKGGVSDYGWSVWMVVVTQILTILVGTLAVGFRWFTLVSHMNMCRFQHCNKVLKIPSYWIYESIFGKLYSLPFKFSKMGCMNFFHVLEDLVGTILHTMQTGVVWMNESVVFLCLLVREILSFVMRNCVKICFGFIDRSSKVEAAVLDSMKAEEEYQEVVYSAENGLKNWIQSIGMEDMKRWMEVNKKDSPTHLNDFLCNNSPSIEETLTQDLEQIGIHYSRNIPYKYNVSCLSVVILVRMASVALPSKFSQSLIHTLDEVFEILHFVDRKLNPENFNNKAKSMLAKDVWMCRDITTHWFQKKFIKPSLKKYYFKQELSRSSSSDLGRAYGIIRELNEHSFGYIILELHTICEFMVKCGDYASIEELFEQIKQLFVDMLHFFLSRLPEAIFKDVVESPIEECEERVSLALKFLCKLELLEANIGWSFPNESEISSLIKGNSSAVSTTDTQDSSMEDSNGSSTGEQSSSMVAMNGDVPSLITNNSAVPASDSIQDFSLMTDNIAGGQSFSVVDGDLHDAIQKVGEIETID